VCLIAISKISRSSGLSPRKKGGIGSRTDPCFGSDTYLLPYVCVYNNVIQLVKKCRHKEYNKNIQEFFSSSSSQTVGYDAVILCVWVCWGGAHTLFDSCWSAGDLTDKDNN
jgi:hypothetical protein